MPRPALMTKRPGGRTTWVAIVLVTALSTAVAVMTFGSPDMKSPGVADAAEAGTTVGAAQYPVPAGAIVVSPSGNDGAAGTAAAPYKTLAKAAGSAAAGATIVLRGGDVSRVRRRLQARHDPIVAGRGRVARRFGAPVGLVRIRWPLDDGVDHRVRLVADVHPRRAGQHAAVLGVRQRAVPDGRAPGADLDRQRRPASGRLARRSHRRDLLPRRSRQQALCSAPTRPARTCARAT